MAINYEDNIEGVKSIYLDNYNDCNKKRYFTIKYSLPEKGVNNETGILLFIAGYGANSNSKVYKKMREAFSDKYNLITLQCDYFGYEFMQNDFKEFTIENMNLDSVASRELLTRLILNNDDGLKFLNKITLISKLDESKENFNDMGIMQALDNITATLNIINKFDKAKNKLNYNKVIIMGNSQGSYLAYLCNYLCRGLYTHILDNSAWVYPQYYDYNRFLSLNKDNVSIKIKYCYAMKSWNLRCIPITIKQAYNEFENKCKIIIYHGIEDELISAKDKYNEVKEINNIEFNLINKDDIDGVVFKSAAHGLSANFLFLFDSFYNNYIDESTVKNCFNIEKEIKILDYFELSYKDSMPKVKLNI